MRKDILLVLALIGLTTGVLAASYFGSSIHSSYGTTNPSNMLDSDSDYGILTYVTLNGTNGTSQCPEGDFSLQADGSCQEADSSLKIRGWTVINFKDNSTNSTLVQDATSVAVRSGNFNDGCSSTGCNMSTTYRVFQTSSLAGSVTDWESTGSVSINFGSTYDNIILTSGDIDAILIARYAGTDERPDPRIEFVKVNN